MDNHPTINNIFTDENELFDDTNLKTEDKNYFQDLIERTDFPEV